MEKQHRIQSGYRVGSGSSLETPPVPPPPSVFNYPMKMKGAQWLSGRVLDSRPKGRGFEPHRRHCVVVLEQDTFILA